MTKPHRKILLVDDAPEDRAIIRHYLLQDPTCDYSGKHLYVLKIPRTEY